MHDEPHIIIVILNNIFAHLSASIPRPTLKGFHVEVFISKLTTKESCSQTQINTLDEFNHIYITIP